MTLHLNDISKIYLEQIAEGKGAGEDQEHKYSKKSGKKSKDYDGDGTVEDETDEYAGVKDNAIKKAMGKSVCKKCEKKECECDDKKVDEIYLLTPLNKGKNKTTKTPTTIDKHGKRVPLDKVKESKNVHGEIEVPSKDLKSLVKKAVSRIDTDVDGDVEDNDKHKGEYGEFVPTPDGKRTFSGPKTRKESFSNWRNEINEVLEKDGKEQKFKEMSKDKTNTIKINPVLEDSIASIDGVVLEDIEFDAPEPTCIFEDFVDAEIYFMDDDFIYDIVEESIVELLDDGYDLDYIVESIVSSVDYSLEVLTEGVAETAARKRSKDVKRTQLRAKAKTFRPDPATLRRNARLKAVKSAAQTAGEKIKSGVKKVGKAASYGAGYAAGATVRAARRLRDKAKEGYARGSQGSSSSSQGSSSSSQGSSSSAPTSSTSDKKRSLLSRVGSGLKKAIKGTVRVGARAVEVGAGAVAAGAKSVRKRMSEEFYQESCEIAAEYFIEEGLNEEGVAILIEELGVDEFAEFVYDLGEEIMLTEELNEARAGGVKVAPVTKAGKSVGSLKGGPRTSAIKRLRKEKAARRDAEAKASAAKPSGMKAALQSQSKTAAKRNTAVSKAKSAQPKKKGVLDRVAGAVLKGIERHNAAMNAARETGKTISKAAKVGAKGAQEFGKGFSSGVKTAGKAAKDAKKVISSGVEYDEELVEGLRSAVKRLLSGKKKEEPAKPMSRGEQLRKKYNVGPEKSDTSAKRQILDRSRARAERDEKEYGGSRYSKSVADKSKAAHDSYLRAGYSKYGADDRRGSGNKARRRAAALQNNEFEWLIDSLISEGYNLSSYTIEEFYDQVIDIEEGLKQARKNVGASKCWTGYRAKGTKMEDGEEVPDCKKESINYEGPLYAQHPDLVEARRGPAAPGKKEKGEKASKSLVDMRNRQKVLDTHEKKTGRKLDISKTPEGKAHAKNFPGSRQAPKKKGAKETPAETQNRRIMKSTRRIVKHGYTSKEKKEVKAMAKHASRYD
jgi:hypothetical protein